MKISDADRFWSKVIKGPLASDCWLWSAAVADDGYGRFWVKAGHGQRVMRAHRFAYQDLTGELLGPGILLMHGCDVPLCVRPTPIPGSGGGRHVAVGTVAGNNLDRSMKLRHANAHSLSWRGDRKRNFAARSRALRDALNTHGWEEAVIRPLLGGHDPDAPTLF